MLNEDEPPLINLDAFFQPQVLPHYFFSLSKEKFSSHYFIRVVSHESRFNILA